MKNLTNISKIKCFVFDYDGVLSDGKVYMLPSGEGLRKSDVKDGYALHHAIKQGYKIAVISGGRGENMRNRLKELGIQDIYLGVSYKKDVFEDYLLMNELSPEEVLYMGDDIPDYEVMQIAGIAACPANSSQEIKSISHYISPCTGGNGCVRDVIEQVMKSQGKWMTDSAFTW
ncbi:HAD hydrolase-like protein [Odoribacter sp. OttesenSCG-928-L07]|nr:HAD hydrolase-like protein [Odoribacter sp. OttesenSCG-928-L07]MDL2238663.1 HAD hydrolase-like protein [Bacteroidales bacterium OttesenSCG-928-L14]MDL2240298.1 HAD hydrolase-like protein [Bacteroidales bacterium OttesenSCG-928-K22]